MSDVQPEGYLALPAHGNGKAVLVLHAWWGLNDSIKTFCNRLSDSGYVAFAPDLYHGNVTDQIAEAEVLGAALDGEVDQARADLAESIAFLRQHGRADESGLAVIGFSLGAYYALDLSVNHPEVIRAVVLFYGTGSADFSQSQASYLGHFAGDDVYEPQANVDALEKSLRDTGRAVTFYRYDGTGHWFFEPDRVQAYDAEASRLAWERTLGFLQDFPA